MSTITVRAARGEELCDVVALSNAWHGRAEDGLAWRWRYQAYPEPGVRTLVGVTARGRIEAACGVLPRAVELPDGSRLPAGLLVDVGCSTGAAGAAALAAVLAAMEGECLGATGMQHLVLPAGPAPAAFGPPTLHIQDYRLDPPRWWTLWRRGPAAIALLSVATPIRGDDAPTAGARLARSAAWLQFRFRDLPRARARLLQVDTGARSWPVALELGDAQARLWAGDLDVDRLLQVVAQVRRDHPAVGAVFAARPTSAAPLPGARAVGPALPVWIRSAPGVALPPRWHVDLEDLPLLQSSLGEP